MAGSSLPVNVDSSYADSGSDPTVQLHQQHHDAVHKVVNYFDKDTAPALGYAWVHDGTVFVPRALLSSDMPTMAVNAQVGTTYTFVLADAGKMVSGSNGSAIAWTVPTNASVAFPVNTVLMGSQLGAGQITVAGAGGVTVNGRGGALKTAGQYSPFTLWQYAANTWLMGGDIST